MTSGPTREFMALCAIAQHFGRPGTPTDQAWIESFFGHLKNEHLHLDKITDPNVLRAELAVIRQQRRPAPRRNRLCHLTRRARGTRPSYPQSPRGRPRDSPPAAPCLPLHQRPPETQPETRRCRLIEPDLYREVRNRSGRVPRHRWLLPVGVQPPPPQQTEARHTTLPGQDAGTQIPNPRLPGLPALPCRASDRPRSPCGTSGRHRARQTKITDPTPEVSVLRGEPHCCVS